MRYLALVFILCLMLAANGCESVSVRADFPPRPPDDFPEPPEGSEGVTVTYGGSGVYPVALHIPPGHLPPPGSCRIWYPGRPPGHQPPPGDCESLIHRVPLGAWLISRPTKEKDYVRVSVYDQTRPSIVVIIRVFDVATGRFVYEEKP
jgi:hypothetical protein